jgi:diguanylate cyclase (GGDEF)-like protein
MRILLVEDDEILVAALQQALSSLRYVIDVVVDGQLAWEYAQQTMYDLILLDVQLPKLDGITLCQRLRSQGYSTPILLMTAREASGDRIRGLDAGADDYLIKPLDFDELQARIRALLRRGKVSRHPILQVGELQLDPSRCQVTYAATPLNLTPKEYNLLELFLRNPARVFSRGQIIEHLWSYDDPPQEESVKAHIKGLRQKLKTVGITDWIENVYGLGYRLKPGIETNGDVANPSDKTPIAQPGTESHIQNTISEGTQRHLQFNQAMAELWLQHRGLMTQRIAVLEQIASAEAYSDQLRQAGEQAAHKLAGVLGMFGWDEGTTIARTIEKALEQQQPSENREKVRSLIQALIHLLNSPMPELTTVASSPATEPTLQSAAVSLSSTELSITEQAIASPQFNQRTMDAQSTTDIMVVDDDPVFLATLRLVLEPWGIAMTELSDPSQFWQVLPTANPDLLILDVNMPQISGIELCQSVRSNEAWQSLPILFLTVHREVEKIQQMFAAGADDYVTKPIVGPELLTRITQRLERLRLLQTLSRKDPITGLVNQQQSYQELTALLQQADRDRLPFSLVLLKASQLHAINVQYGHAIGHQLLRQWGTVLRSALGTSEGMGYWGDGEFVIGRIGATKAKIDQQIASVLLRLQQSVTTTEGIRLRMVCETAIAEYPTEGLTLQSLYQHASTNCV